VVGEEEIREWIVTLDDRNEWTEILADLVDGRETITRDELLALVPEIEEDDDLLDALVEDLDKMGVGIEKADEADDTGQEVSTPETPDLDNMPTDDLLDVYLAEVSREPLLSHEDEIELGQQIEMGRMAQKALEETDYNAREYARLKALVETGQAAREHLGQANTRLVISIAKRYRGYGIPFTDLIQDGNVGLMRAIDHYDHRTGYRFSTYATWWIRQAVTRSLSNHGRLVRIPVHTGNRIRKMNQVAQRLEMEQGERPTAAEIAAEMDESPEKVDQMMRWAKRPVSLEQPAGEDGDVELRDFIQDENIVQPEEVTDVHLLHEALGPLLDQLTVREITILRLRYGLGGAQTLTLSEIGKKLGLSRERIRQIERHALAKLRLVGGDQRLEQFL
jgi:RNA polymerase primary sigma factor